MSFIETRLGRLTLTTAFGIGQGIALAIPKIADQVQHTSANYLLSQEHLLINMKTLGLTMGIAMAISVPLQYAFLSAMAKIGSTNKGN